MTNLYDFSSSSNYRRLIQRLDALLFVLRDCVGDVCREPWKKIHSDGNVKSLSDALNEEYDNVYEGTQRLVIYECLDYYDPKNEGTVSVGNKREGQLVLQGEGDVLFSSDWKRTSSVVRGKTKQTAFHLDVQVRGGIEDYG